MGVLFSDLPQIVKADLASNDCLAILDLSADILKKVNLEDIYSDNLAEYEDLAHFPLEGQDKKIYLALDTNKIYRWDTTTTTYIEISKGLELGDTNTTAFAGNRGKAIEDVVPSGASTANLLVTATDLTAKQNINLTTPIVVEETTYTTVESAMNAINNKAVTVTVDDAMSTTSTNPVQNKVITEALDGKANVERKSGYGDTWSTKTWSGLTTSLNGAYIWTDGENTYYSSGLDQYVLDKSTSTWSTKTWSGLTSFFCDYIWTDGDNIYYSYNNTNQYVLDKSTSTWSTKTWSGLTNISGERVWTDGNNIYYSSGSSQYVLDKSTSTWSTKTWSGLTSFRGDRIWTDGNNIYYSYSSEQYVLDKSTSTWSTKTWSGLASFSSAYIWTDGNNTYYSSGSSQYVLDKSTSTWSTKTWSGLTNFSGGYIWTDGENIFYSYSSDQYVLDKMEGTVIEDSIIVKSNGDLQGAAEIYDNAGNALSEKYDATSLTFPNERFTITASSWSSSQTGGYYTYTLSTGSTKYNTYSDVTMANVGSTDSTDATSAEKAAYALVNKFDMANGTGVNSFTLYAKTKPTTTFYIKLSGRYMAKNAASSTKALDIETANALSLIVKSSYATKVNLPFNGGAACSLTFSKNYVQISASDWSSTVNADGYYYTSQKTLQNSICPYLHGDVQLINLNSDSKPETSATAIAAYNMVDYFDLVDSSHIVAYAKTKPTSNFNIDVSGFNIAYAT